MPVVTNVSETHFVSVGRAEDFPVLESRYKKLYSWGPVSAVSHEYGYVTVLFLEAKVTCRWVRPGYQQAADSVPPSPCINIARLPGLKSSPAVFHSAGNKSLSNTAGLLELFHTLTEGQGLEPGPTSAHCSLWPCVLSKDVLHVYRRSQWPRGPKRRPWQLGRWDPSFESRLRHGCLSSYHSLYSLVYEKTS
jgi:hypothetical protein